MDLQFNLKFSCQLLLQIGSIPQGQHWINALELYAGVGAISAAFRAAGLRSCQVDILYDEELHDLEGIKGLIYALCLLWRLAPGAILWMAPVCSSWLWCCRASTLRSWIEWQGSSKTVGVAGANMAVSRCTS